MNESDIFDIFNRLLLQTSMGKFEFITYIIYNHETKFVHFREEDKPDIISPMTVEWRTLQRWFNFLGEEVFNVEEIFNVNNRGKYFICGPKRILEKIVQIHELEKKIEELERKK